MELEQLAILDITAFMADTETVAKSEPEHKPKPLTFKAFLEGVPPNRECEVVEVRRAIYRSPDSVKGVGPSRLLLYCDTPVCKGDRYFDTFGEYKRFEPDQDRDIFLTYRCSNCKKTLKKYALRLICKGI